MSTEVGVASLSQGCSSYKRKVVDHVSSQYKKVYIIVLHILVFTVS